MNTPKPLATLAVAFSVAGFFALAGAAVPQPPEGGKDPKAATPKPEGDKDPKAPKVKAESKPDKGKAGGPESKDEKAEADKPKKGGWDADTWAGLALRGIGPAVTSGRVVDVAVDPTDRKRWFVATAAGGVWKTENGGIAFAPVFDGGESGKIGSYSIGCVTIDPRNPYIVWVGTGENNSQRSVGYGDGVYKSEDGGRSWKNVGLKSSEHIGKILVHPKDSNTVYVAAQGPLWAPGGERGLYKTTDGGKTWTQALKNGDNT